VTDQGRQLVDGARRVRQALEHTAAALTAADLDGLLRGEADLELALKTLTAPPSLPAEDRQALRQELDALRKALLRCRRLGGALLDVVRLSLDAQGRTAAYGRPGAPAAVYGPRRVNATG
jgi:hypothetical protein